MNIDSRIIGESAIFAGSKVTDVDITGIVRRLLLFDKYVLVSVRLQEFPILVKYLGFGGLIDLLHSNLIEIRCECLQLGQTGQTTNLDRPALPLYHYRFNLIDAHDKTKYISDCLRPIHDVGGLRHSQHLKLKKAIADSIQPLPPELKPRLFPAFLSEFQNVRLLRTAIDMVILKQLSAYGIPFTISVHQLSEDTFRVESDLATIAKITDSEAHGIIQAGIMGVAGLSQAIMEMEAYSAISGFTDHDLPLFRHKLNQFYELASSEKREHTFDRVINIADIADFSPSQELINISQLLKVRDSIELKEFRRWLPEIGRSTDQEIASAVSSVRAKLGLKVGGTKGKIIRALVTSGVLVRSLVGSIVLNLCDAFLVERLLPRTGIAAFVNELYPSLFKSKAEPMSGEDFSLASAKEKAPLEH